MKKSIGIFVVASIVLFSNRLLAQEVSPKPGCNIKGNLSLVRKGNKFAHIPEKKLYHLPGMKDYEGTLINRPGEKWFCSESEAIANGWKKAPR
jgi:hypothetical protein